MIRDKTHRSLVKSDTRMKTTKMYWFHDYMFNGNERNRCMSCGRFLCSCKTRKQTDSAMLLTTEHRPSVEPQSSHSARAASSPGSERGLPQRLLLDHQLLLAARALQRGLALVALRGRGRGRQDRDGNAFDKMTC